MVGNIDNLGLGLGFGNVFALAEEGFDPGIFEAGMDRAANLFNPKFTLPNGVENTIKEDDEKFKGKIRTCFPTLSRSLTRHILLFSLIHTRLPIREAALLNRASTSLSSPD